MPAPRTPGADLRRQSSPDGAVGDTPTTQPSPGQSCRLTAQRGGRDGGRGQLALVGLQSTWRVVFGGPAPPEPSLSESGFLPHVRGAPFFSSPSPGWGAAADHRNSSNGTARAKGGVPARKGAGGEGERRCYATEAWLRTGEAGDRTARQDLPAVQLAVLRAAEHVPAARCSS